MQLQATIFFKNNKTRVFSLLLDHTDTPTRAAHVNPTICLRATTVRLACDRLFVRAYCNTKKKSPESKNIRDLASRAKISNYIMPPL
jgi:hypothetical protein